MKIMTFVLTAKETIDWTDRLNRRVDQVDIIDQKSIHSNLDLYWNC